MFKILLSSKKPFSQTELDKIVNLARHAQNFQIYRVNEPRLTTPRYYFSLLENTTAVAGLNEYPDNRAKSEASIRQVIQLLQGRPAEGMHLVEHLLLRPVEGVNEVLNPVAFPVRSAGSDPASVTFIEDPCSFQVSIFLPGWTPRFQDPEFRVVVERVLRGELPAHIFSHIYWVELDGNKRVPAEFITFETSWRNWLENQFTVSRPVAQDPLVQAINQLVISPFVTPAYRYQAFEL